MSFLTRLPVGRGTALDADDVAAAGPAFPLVGAAIGAAVGALSFALAHVLPSLLAAGLAVAAGTLLTGALHLDALADVADALGASSRERALSIMRDPTVGAFAAVAVALDLLLKVGALSALATRGRVIELALAAGALSRAAPVLLAAFVPYARPSGGTGLAMTAGGARRAAVAGVVGAAIALVAAGVDGAALMGLTAAVTAMAAIAARRWLGGVTGDVLGATLELAETGSLVLAVGLVVGR